MSKEKLSRPFPLDEERKRRVMTELARRGWTITELAHRIGLKRQNLSALISGRIISGSMQGRVADFLQIDVRYLFPVRSLEQSLAMRDAENERKGAA